MSGPPYEVLAVRYGTRTTTASHMFLNHATSGEPDRQMRLDYFFWVVRSAERTVVVDTGYSPEAALARDRPMTCPPHDCLARLDVDPGAVDLVVVTHGHYDHTGNVGLFPNAEVVVSDRELTFWSGPFAARRHFVEVVDQPDIATLLAVEREERLVRTTGDSVVAPGVEVQEFGGHSPGQLVVRVEAALGTTILLTSDAVHFYEEVEQDRPFAVVADLEQLYRGYDRVAAATAAGEVVVAGHDPRVLDLFPAVDTRDPGFAVQVC